MTDSELRYEIWDIAMDGIADAVFVKESADGLLFHPLGRGFSPSQYLSDIQELIERERPGVWRDSQ